MKLYGKDENGKVTETVITWSDHWPSCERCREVSIAKPSTFAGTCAQGAPLLMEELAKQQAPVEKQKTAAVRAWADKAGVFKMGSANTVTTKYKE